MPIPAHYSPMVASERLSVKIAALTPIFNAQGLKN
jgi:hypothetical protein